MKEEMLLYSFFNNIWRYIFVESKVPEVQDVRCTHSNINNKTVFFSSINST